jgi:predicted DNA-binding protein
VATENKQVSTWLPEDIAARVQELAAEDRRTVSMWIRLLIEARVSEADRKVAA